MDDLRAGEIIMRIVIVLAPASRKEES